MRKWICFLTFCLNGNLVGAITPSDRFISIVTENLTYGSVELRQTVVNDLFTLDFTSSAWEPFLDKLATTLSTAATLPFGTDKKGRPSFAEVYQIDLAVLLTAHLRRSSEGIQERAVSLLDEILNVPVTVGAPSLLHFNYKFWISAAKIIEALKPNNAEAVTVLIKALLRGAPGDGHTVGSGMSLTQYEARFFSFGALSEIIGAHPDAANAIPADALQPLYLRLAEDSRTAVPQFFRRYVLSEEKARRLDKLEKVYNSALLKSWVNKLDFDLLPGDLIAALIEARRAPPESSNECLTEFIKDKPGSSDFAWVTP